MEICELDLAKEEDIGQFIQLLDAYRMTPGGGGKALSQAFKTQLQSQTACHGNLIAFVAVDRGTPIGVVLGTSYLFIFSARPYANVQFIFVRPEQQGHGVARQLMQAFEAKARELGCCKVTLEVRETNTTAKELYRRLEYGRGTFGPDHDPLEFWEKTLG